MRFLIGLLATIFFSASALAQNTTISHLPAATSIVDGTEVVPLVQSGVTKSASISIINTFVRSLLPPIALSGNAADLAGTLKASSFPAFTGDCASSAGSVALICTKTSGAPFVASATTDTTNASNITSGTLNVARLPAFTGDATAPVGTGVTTLATVNSNVGTFGSSTAIPSFVVNAKGLVTAASTVVVVAPAGTLTGSTLAAGVTGSSLTSLGTVTTGTWNASPISNAFLAPMPTLTIKGNVTGASAVPTDLTATQATSILNGCVGDSGSGGTKGLVPAPPAGSNASNFFLAANCTFKAPPSAAIIVPTIQKFLSGSGTYTTPTGATWIRIRQAGGGAGGNGAGSTTPAGTAGGNTTFGTTLLVANGGGVGGTTVPGATAGAGGTCTIGSGPIGISFTGGMGSGGAYNNTSAFGASGGVGGANFLGGGGGGGPGGAIGGSAIANTGGGGGGGGSGNSTGLQGGPGGGAGCALDVIITAPSATYPYAVGAAGTAGTGGTNGNAGGAGGSGIIVVEEHYGS